MLSSLFKAAAAIVDVPVAIAADVITMGGMTTDKEQTYTGQAASRLVQNVKNITKPD